MVVLFSVVSDMLESNVLDSAIHASVVHCLHRRSDRAVGYCKGGGLSGSKRAERCLARFHLRVFETKTTIPSFGKTPCG
jgi:hypothetical protein